MTAGQVLLLACAMATWLVGANVVVAFHYRRIGGAWWSGFRPFAFPFKAFNVREWVILAVLAATSLTLLGLAVS